ncbi:zinc finger protein [Diaporthe amygdali]|uniref:zinc finger protein n=1 Tax=Phomopsis amygdali TaxID=1214568 RepID=UPI0022FE5572|nr:zinc finger protein [Diaporthe amygdali]KAJ0120112.1 zinc finger protein [Diaporthe amygdali]
MEAHPGRDLAGLCLSPNIASDVSCSSGPCSVVSTRETSPASSTHHPLETTSTDPDMFKPRSDHIPGTPSPGPDLSRPRPGQVAGLASPLEMNPNQFQSVNDRRSKLAVDNPRASHASSGTTAGGNNTSHHLQPTTVGRSLAPIAPPHPPSAHLPSSTIPRGLSTTNWRSSTASLDSLTAPSTTTSSGCTSSVSGANTKNLALVGSSNLLGLPISSVDFSNQNSLLGHNSYVPTAGLSSNTPTSAFHHDFRHFERHQGARNNEKMHPQTGKLIADSDMDQAMSYCYDRGGGQYTRLVPVDMLPIELKDIPRRVNTDEGMIVLPVPHQPGPDGQLANIQLESVVTPPTSPNGVSTDNIQSRIDSIINSSPSASSSALVLSTRGFDGATNRSLTTQSHGSGAPGGGPRREKIYCDKWIHDGTCAFTQQGCKYKHEMPHDRETQEKLGLFHGYPAWWKKQAVEQQRPLAIDDRPVSVGPARGSFPTSVSAGVLGSSLSSAVVSSNWRSGAGNVGDGGVQGTISPTAPAAGTSGSSGLSRSGSIGFGGSSRGTARQPRTFASFQPATYGPIAPPSRAGTGGSSGTSTGFPTTRNTRALTTSSTASTDDGPRGSGVPFYRSVFDPSNPFAALGSHSSQARGRQEESSSGDTATNSGEEGEQRGAPL